MTDRPTPADGAARQPEPTAHRRRERRADGCLVAIALLTLGLGVAQQLVAERWWATLLVCYLPPAPWLVGLAGLALALWRPASWRGRRLAGLVLVALLGSLPAGWLPRPRRLPAGEPVRVVSYNVFRLDEGLEPIVAIAERTRPDLVCLQEAIGRPPDYLDLRELKQRLPGWHLYQEGELALLSPHPLTGRRPIPATAPRRWPIITAELQLPGGPLRVFCVHFTNAFNLRLLRLNRHRAPGMLTEFTARRAVQLEELLAEAGEVAGPAILVGDFNTPPRGLFYTALRSQWRDAFAEAGWGLGGTWPVRFPLVRIDYLWAGPDIHVRRCVTDRQPGSDHRPLLVDLTIDRSD